MDVVHKRSSSVRPQPNSKHQGLTTILPYFCPSLAEQRNTGTQEHWKTQNDYHTEVMLWSQRAYLGKISTYEQTNRFLCCMLC